MRSFKIDCCMKNTPLPKVTLKVTYWARGQTSISRETQHWTSPQGDSKRQYWCFVSFQINLSAIFITEFISLGTGSFKVIPHSKRILSVRQTLKVHCEEAQKCIYCSHFDAVNYHVTKADDQQRSGAFFLLLQHGICFSDLGHIEVQCFTAQR